MIQIAGVYDSSIDTTWNNSLNMNVNLCWIDHSFINDEIRQELRKIAEQKIKQPSCYMKLFEGRDDILIPNEKDYNENVIFFYNYRLLALFRFWNVIYYFYPYKYLIDQSWDIVLSDFIPQFITASNIPSFHNIIRKLTTRMNDGHVITNVSHFYDIFKFSYITLVDTFTVIRTPQEGSSLKRGDIILSLNNQNIRSVRDSVAVWITSSNNHFTENAINGWIYHVINNGCSITVLRNQQVMTFKEDQKAVRTNTEVPLSFYEISNDIYYTNLAKLKSAEVPGLMDSLKNYKSIIIDLRNYPVNSGFDELLCNLSQTQDFDYAMSTCVDFSHYGAFYILNQHVTFPDELLRKRKYYNGKVVVLINSSTMSAAETKAMCFRNHGATLVGTRSAGANGGVIDVSLFGGITVSYPCYGFYFPDGTQIQKTGIIPDIEIYPTMDDIEAGRDEIIEAAIKFINFQ